MPDPSARVLMETTLLAQVLLLTRQDTDVPVTSGVTVTCEVFRPGVGSAIATGTLVHTAGGNWQVVIDVISGLVLEERVDVKWKVDGGASLSRVWWDRGVRVAEGEFA